MRHKGKLNGLELHKGRKSKNSKCVGMWFNAIGSLFKFRHAPCLHDHVTGHVVSRHSFNLELVWERDSIIIHILAYRTAHLTSFPFTLLYSPLSFYFTLFHFTLLSLPSCLVKINLNSPSSSFGHKRSGLKNYSITHLHSILLPLESKQCPLTLASVLACADSAGELRF